MVDLSEEMEFVNIGTEEWIDYESEDCSSHSCNDDLKDDPVEELNAGHTEEVIEVEGNEGYKNITDLSVTDIMNMDFDSEEKAHEFYVKYAKCVGFAVRRDDVVRDAKGNIIRRHFVCTREGLRAKKHYMRVDRKREHRPVTRTSCNARLLVYLDTTTSRWKVSKFEVAHNHELTPPKYIHLIPNYRGLTDADKAQVDSMHSYGIRTAHIMGFMTGQAGGYVGVGFCKKDLYNYIDRQRRVKIADGDAFAALSYLQAKADTDPMMFARYTTTDDGRLGNLFWADGMCRVDYEYFGDVLAFDTTYKKNKYNKPLVIFSGANHHRQTCVFACALLVDERVETYKWVLDTFLAAMHKKEPEAVVTDGDKAMRKAIKALFPNASHRLCAWHLHKNANSNIKNKEFSEAFKKCIYANFEPDEFEEHWSRMIENFGLAQNKWVKKTYKRKTMWATAYLCDKFYAGVRTTSQCEGINSFIKGYINSRHSLVELIHHFERAVRDYRNNELVADFNSMYGEPVLTSALDSIERGAANVFTREIFRDFREEIELAAALFVVERDTIATTIMFKMNKYGKPGRVYNLIYDFNSEKFDCYCRLWNTHGIPCCHIVCAMRHEHMEALPEKMILKRWTKNAKCHDLSSQEANADNDKMFLMRYGALCSQCNWMSFLAAKNLHDYAMARDEVCRLTSKLERKCSLIENGNSVASGNVVGDPVMVKTKGAPPARKKTRKRRRCSNCNMPGHTIRTCPKLNGSQSQRCAGVDDRNSTSSSDETAGQGRLTTDKTIGSSSSMMGSQTTRPMISFSGNGEHGQQFYPTEGLQHYYATSVAQPYFGASQGIPYYPAGLAQQHCLPPTGPSRQHSVAAGGLSQQHSLGPTGLSQQQYIAPAVLQQWYPQPFATMGFMPNQNTR